MMNLPDRLRNAVEYVRARSLECIEVTRIAKLWNDIILAADELDSLRIERDALTADVEDSAKDESIALSQVEEYSHAVGRLQGIIAKLPMCWRLKGKGDERELIQDCPVVPGMEVFAVRRGCVVEKHRVVQFVVYAIHPAGGGDCDRLWFQVNDCYNSREAAEFAKEQEE